MIWSVDWDGGFVVGGDDRRRLTPNFRLGEFRRADGGVRVHREVVSALQILRDRLGRGLGIRATDDDGLGATIAADPAADLLQAAADLQAHGLFASASAAADGVHVRIPDPAALPAVGLEQALEAAFSVTSGFETSGDRFQQVTGNFDGAGISFGPAQVNFKSGTLVPLFRAFAQADEATLRGCFADPIDYQEFQRVLDLPVAEQIAWADGVSTGRSMADVIQPWKGYFQAVGRVEAFRAIMVESILRLYGRKVLRAAAYLQSLAPQIDLDHLRCFCSLYDLVIQQGSLDRAHDQIEQRVATERPSDQFALVRIAVEERGKKASERFVSDCLSRRLGVLDGVPKTVGDTQRANVNFYLLRDVRIADARGLMTADVGEQLDRVSQALAAGRTLIG